MLTIHSAINQNYQQNPVFGKSNRAKRREQDEQNNMSEMDRLKREYDEERSEWIEHKQGIEEMIRDKEANLPKPLKTTMKGGVILAAGVLGGMATGYSAKYIMTAFQKMYKSKQVQAAVKSFDKHISTPVKKGLTTVKNYVTSQFAKLKKTDSYKNNTAKIKNKYNQFTTSKFAKSVKEFFAKIANNKIVKKVTGAIDTVFSAIGEGVVKIYNKLARVNYKNAAADTLGVAGGVSTGAVALMDEVKKPKDNEKSDSDVHRYIEEEI